MDFDPELIEKQGHGDYEPLPAENLPNLYVAYKTELGKVSGTVLNDIRQRVESGDAATIETIQEIASLAEEGRQCIMERDHERLDQLINRNFDLRTRIMRISPSNYEMVETARRCGASAKFSGSGGTIIGSYRDDDVLSKLVVNLKKIKARVIKPIIQ